MGLLHFFINIHGARATKYADRSVRETCSFVIVK
jgi:hypothetical protein